MLVMINEYKRVKAKNPQVASIAGDLFGSLRSGDKVHVIFGGGMEGKTIGTVIEPRLHESTDFRFVVEADFWNDLSRRWHRKGETLIAHAHELVAILSKKDYSHDL